MRERTDLAAAAAVVRMSASAELAYGSTNNRSSLVPTYAKARRAALTEGLSGFSEAIVWPAVTVSPSLTASDAISPSTGARNSWMSPETVTGVGCWVLGDPGLVLGDE